jgi:nucleotide-binding universal stress UspA family protein
VQVIDSISQIVAQTTPATIEPLPTGSITVDIAEQAVAGQREKADANLDSVRQRVLAEGAAGSVTTLVIEGSPGPALEQAVVDQGCDVVVIATHGRSGFKRAILGSVADHLVRNSPGASVLLVEPEDAA